MNTSSQDQVWIIDNKDTGPQRWLLKGKRFTEVTLESGDSIAVQDHPDIDFLRPRYGSHCVDTDCPNIFPGTFDYCPFCGAEIVHDDDKRLITAVEQQWSSIATGFEELPFTVNGTSLQRQRDNGRMAYDVQSITLPPGGPFAFIVGGSSHRLYAFDQESCILRVKELLFDNWHELARLPRAEPLPSWSRAVAQGVSGFALVTKKDIFWISLPRKKTDVIQPLEGLNEDRYFLAGAGQSGPVVAAPLLHAGRLAIAWRNSETDDKWRLLEDIPISQSSNGTQVDMELPAPNGLGAPVQDVRGSLYWAGTDGFLVCDISDGALQQARWVKWVPNQRGRPEFRPLKEGKGYGGVYQLTFDTSESQSTAHKMSGINPISQTVDGPFFSSGFNIFYEHFRYSDNPWEGYPSEKFDPSEQTVFPLLALGVKPAKLRAPQVFFARTATRLHDGWKAGGHPFEVDVFCHNVDGNTIEVKRGLRLSWPSDMSMFLFDKRMYLYDAFENSLWSWTVEVIP